MPDDKVSPFQQVLQADQTGAMFARPPIVLNYETPGETVGGIASVFAKALQAHKEHQWEVLQKRGEMLDKIHQAVETTKQRYIQVLVNQGYPEDVAFGLAEKRFGRNEYSGAPAETAQLQPGFMTKAQASTAATQQKIETDPIYKGLVQDPTTGAWAIDPKTPPWQFKDAQTRVAAANARDKGVLTDYEVAHGMKMGMEYDPNYLAALETRARITAQNKTLPAFAANWESGNAILEAMDKLATAKGGDISMQNFSGDGMFTFRAPQTDYDNWPDDAKKMYSVIKNTALLPSDVAISQIQAAGTADMSADAKLLMESGVQMQKARAYYHSTYGGGGGTSSSSSSGATYFESGLSPEQQAEIDKYSGR